jgi:3-hydroxybutyryl-CoA dehydrogenase
MILGVVGAGTMGAGIAQLGCQAGAETRLLDADGAALERARGRIAAGLQKAEAKGRAAQGAVEHLRTVTDTAALAGCDVVIEAIPEDLALKHRVLATSRPRSASAACSRRTPPRCRSPRSPRASRAPSASWACTSSTPRR